MKLIGLNVHLEMFFCCLRCSLNFPCSTKEHNKLSPLKGQWHDIFYTLFYQKHLLGPIFVFTKIFVKKTCVRIVIDYADMVSALSLTVLTQCLCSCCWLCWHGVRIVSDHSDTTWTRVSVVNDYTDTCQRSQWLHGHVSA